MPAGLGGTLGQSQMDPQAKTSRGVLGYPLERVAFGVQCRTCNIVNFSNLLPGAIWACPRVPSEAAGMRGAMSNMCHFDRVS